MIVRLLRLCLCCSIVAVACCHAVHALPPLGLTPTNLTSGGLLEIIDGTAYISTPSGICTVSSSGNLGLITLSHPTLGSSRGITRTVKAVDGFIYAASVLGQNSSNLATHSALFRIDQPLSPIVTWNYAGVRGVDVNLRTFGNIGTDLGGFIHYEATWFYLDGSTEILPFPPGSVPANSFTLLYSATPNGYAIGEATVPMTAGIGPVVWEPDGDISFLPGDVGEATSVREDLASTSANIGYHNFFIPIVNYSDGSLFPIFNENGELFYDEFNNLSDYSVVVSQGEFTVVGIYQNYSQNASALYAFYPGIVIGFDNRAVPLLDIFPELASIDIDTINDLASVDGYLYMTLSGSDGTFLFGARDPSVTIPEPAGVVMMVIVALAGSLRCRRYP